ncbi:MULTISPECIES: hypothetical protein [unclassified Caballeronia]|nr:MULTISPECIES: hypothetical protein [unclassified Caballeronia]MDR5752607.1 hypothetical protein [Caballeronia sp. LZ024]MDR5841635.1 hypothetical protein [Caballeronia sp. LZ031]
MTIDAPEHTYALAFSAGQLFTILCFQTELTVPFKAAVDGT